MLIRPVVPFIFVKCSTQFSTSRDEIEAAVKFWRDSSKSKFDIEELREYRLTNYFGNRYDARLNLIDWDYHMRLKDIAPIIHIFHYKRWRMYGMAFEIREIEYNLPNRTLASFRAAQHKAKGSVAVRGYWSDILVSPYVPLGTSFLPFLCIGHAFVPTHS